MHVRQIVSIRRSMALFTATSKLCWTELIYFNFPLYWKALHLSCTISGLGSPGKAKQGHLFTNTREKNQSNAQSVRVSNKQNIDLCVCLHTSVCVCKCESVLSYVGVFYSSKPHSCSSNSVHTLHFQQINDPTVPRLHALSPPLHIHNICTKTLHTQINTQTFHPFF